jgi:hypothetical protein
VLFFCTPEVARVAGEGTTAAIAYTKETRRPAPATVFENMTFRNQLKKAGITQCAKVPIAQENAELIKKYGVNPAVNTLVFCAPWGDPVAAFAGSDCSLANIQKFLASFDQYYAAWRKTHAPKTAAK